MQRKAIESMLEDTGTVYAQTERVENGRTKKAVSCVYQDIPCRLSFSSISATSAGDGADKAPQTVKLFVLPDVDIKAGSRIHVVRASGAVSDWRAAGRPADYQTHKEYVLEPLEVYA